jgi:hypothetical protein
MATRFVSFAYREPLLIHDIVHVHVYSTTFHDYYAGLYKCVQCGQNFIQSSYTDEYDGLCLLSTTALTVDNILKELKQVKWEILHDVLQLPYSQRRKIERKYAGETERKSERVKYWLWNYPYASWRWLITQLDREREHAVADQIPGYAEKLTGMLGSSLY